MSKGRRPGRGTPSMPDEGSRSTGSGSGRTKSRGILGTHHLGGLLLLLSSLQSAPKADV